MRIPHRLGIHFGAAIALAFGSSMAQVQSVMVYEGGQSPTAEDVANILSRGASEVIKLRGQANAGEPSPFALLQQTPTKHVEQASALSLPVHFEFDSAVLSLRAKEQLDVVAEGIRLTEGTVKVVIEGHTDAKGAIAYNESLSFRRAAAVRMYLSAVKKLPVKLLTIEGKGPHKLLDEADPYSAVNRRVQFRAG